MCVCVHVMGVVSKEEESEWVEEESWRKRDKSRAPERRRVKGASGEERRSAME